MPKVSFFTIRPAVHGRNLANTIIQVVVGEPSCSRFASGLDGSEQARALRAAAHQEGKTMHIGFIGLGQMGAGMAANLVKAGHDVTVYNRTRAKAEALVAQGAKAAASVSDTCRGDAVITMLANDYAVENVVLGDEGIIASLPAGAIHISSSTISVALSEALASAHAKAGQRFVAAPVFGLDDRGDQKIDAEFHKIGGLRRLGNDEGLLSDRVEERCRGFDRVVLTCGNDEELARSREVGAPRS